MPYIDPSRRAEWDAIVEQVPDTGGVEDGEVNYLITKILSRVYRMRYGSVYATYNSAIGVLECVKLELYRRQVTPYEDFKMLQNGDVYDGFE